jgi:phage terminase large subunit GpA-like protein
MTKDKPVCPKCESKRVVILSDKTILCRNKKCLTMTMGESACDNCDKWCKNNQLEEVNGLKICQSCKNYYDDGKEFEEMLEEEND